jgi:hypothetical protein
VKRTVAALAGAIVLMSAGFASARGRAVFTLAVGYNGLPAAADRETLRPLRFADDDAARIHALGRQIGQWSRLLALLDAETLERFPELAGESAPPSRAELKRAVSELATAVAEAASRGDEPVVLFYYSGHGARRPDGSASLTLLDGELTQEDLYDQVLAPLAPATVHLVVDACHAEAAVRPRDAQAAVVDVSAAQMNEYLGTATLARFPRVGVIVASSRDAQAHEWDAYAGGVFTHEILSGLRGGADVNGDGRVEYSEMAAFLAAANRAVTTPEARLKTVVQAPPANPRAPLAVLGTARGGWLQGRPAVLGSLHVEDTRGERLVDLHAELGARIALLLPTEVPLYIRTLDSEAEVQLRAGERVDFATLGFKHAPLSARGAVDSSLRRGLFATAFGASYYRGYVDSQASLVPVELQAVDLTVSDGSAKPTRPIPGAAVLSLGAAGALAATSVGFGVVAWNAHQEWQGTPIEREASLAADRYDRARTAVFITAGAAVVAAAVGAYLWWRAN